MGKSDERGDITIRAGESTFIPKTSSEASKMLEAALLQMDDIISGACIESNNEGTAEWKDSVKEATRNLVTAIKSSPNLPSTPDAASIEILLQWMQPVDYMEEALNKNSMFSCIYNTLKYTQTFLKIVAF
ncbi:uncharacterized protein LOC144469699 [Augochlora pura]